MVAKRSSKSKSMSAKNTSSVKRPSVKRSSAKTSSVKRASVKRSSMKKRMSNKKKAALGAVGGLAALIAGRELYKREKAAKAGNGVAPSAKAKSFFDSIRARFYPKKAAPSA
jgi:hypothetical protein